MSMRRAASLLVALVIGAVLAMGIGTPAGAVDNPTYTAPPPTTPVTSPAPEREPVETAVQRPEVRTQLAITGADAGALAVGGTLLIAGGIAALYARRRTLPA